LPDRFRRPADQSCTNSPALGAKFSVAEADETFQAYHQARYVNEIAAAGKAEFAIPVYINVWLSYPPAELPERRIPIPGIQYPSGGAVQKFVGLWRALAPAIDMIGPDIYASDFRLRARSHARLRQTRQSSLYSGNQSQRRIRQVAVLRAREWRYRVLAVWRGSKRMELLGDDPVKAHASNFALLSPMSGEIARLNFEGKLKTSVEEPGQAQQELDFGSWQASVNYGFPQYDGRRPPGNKDFHGTALVAQLGPDEFLVTGLDSSVSFHLPGRLPGIRMQILSAEEGVYEAALGSHCAYGTETKPIAACNSTARPRW